MLSQIQKNKIEKYTAGEIDKAIKALDEVYQAKEKQIKDNPPTAVKLAFKKYLELKKQAEKLEKQANKIGYEFNDYNKSIGLKTETDYSNGNYTSVAVLLSKEKQAKVRQLEELKRTSALELWTEKNADAQTFMEMLSKQIAKITK